jgi:hypothetical protein
MSQQKLVNGSQKYVEAAKEFIDNPGQLKAYDSTGNCVVLAGPGSGKTKTLTANWPELLLKIFGFHAASLALHTAWNALQSWSDA